MVKRMNWSNEERELLQKHFNTKWTQLTLYQKIHKINPFRTYESITRELRRMREKGGFVRDSETALLKLRIGYLDIEATNLVASFGHMLSWYIKRRGKNEYDCGVITPAEIRGGEFDRRITKELLEAFKNYDILYAHYGGDRRFDIPFIQTRAIIHGFGKDLPQPMERFIADTWVICRNKCKFHSNRLDAVALTLGVRNVKKTELNPDIWMRARTGDKTAIEYVALHNKRDVQLLERVHRKLEPVERRTLRSIN